MHTLPTPVPAPIPPFKRLIAAAFGLQLVSDLPERLARTPVPYRPSARRRASIEAMRLRGILFVHVPKNAGTSVCETLYGLQVKHRTVRYYASVAPDLLDLPSFAIVRDPVSRFLSAYRYACSGGTCDRGVSQPFNSRYRAFRGIDDALEHLARSRTPFDLDHIFRPQSWYLTGHDGHCRVDRLVPYHMLDDLGWIVGVDELDGLPRLNRSSCPNPVTLDRGQEAFVRDFYARDSVLWDQAARLTSPRSGPCSARRATS